MTRRSSRRPSCVSPSATTRPDIRIRQRPFLLRAIECGKRCGNAVEMLCKTCGFQLKNTWAPVQTPPVIVDISFCIDGVQDESRTPGRSGSA
jgi:hypothetical protein